MKPTPYHEGYITCPYIPKDFPPMNYQDYLNYYSTTMFNGTTLPTLKLHPEKTILDIAQETFQKKWPGNYHIEEFYNPKKGRIDLRLKFQDPREETMWFLKWA